jgi:hypothetical protein
MARNTLVTIEKSEIRRRARNFARSWVSTTSEQSEKQTFWNEFFAVFGVQRRQVAAYEAIAKRASTGRQGWIDLLVPGHMGVEHKSAGKSLEEAMAQLIDYLPSLPPAEHPWLLIVSDFGHFKWKNLDTDAVGTFTLEQFPDYLELFWWLAGYQVAHHDYSDEIAANLTATELLADVYDALLSSGYPPADSREWLTRLLFCLFADDASVWDRGAFHSYLALHTAPDGHDFGDVIHRIFRVLNTPPSRRPNNLDEDIAQFTYINGDLFANDLWPVSGTAEIRRAMLAASSSISVNVLSSQAKLLLRLGAGIPVGQLRTFIALFLCRGISSLLIKRSIWLWTAHLHQEDVLLQSPTECVFSSHPTRQ